MEIWKVSTSWEVHEECTENMTGWIGGEALRELSNPQEVLECWVLGKTREGGHREHREQD